MTIKKIILLSIICFVIMPILLLPLITTRMYEGILGKKINVSTEQKLEQIANNLENAVTSMLATSNILCSDQEIIDILGKNESGDDIEKFYDYKTINEKITKSFNAVLIAYQADLVLWGGNGKIYSTSDGYDTFDYKEIIRQEWYKKTVAMGGYALWLAPAKNHMGLNVQGTGENIVMTRLIKDDTSTGYYGVLAISLYPDKNIRKLFKTEDSSENAQLLLADKENVVILAEKDEDIGKKLENEMDVTELSGGKSSFIADVTGQKTFVNFYHIKRTDWKVLQLIPYESLMSEVKQLRFYNFAINLILMAVLVLISLIISNSIANPLHKLSILMNSVSKGDFSVKSSVKGNSEIATLSRSFNSMVEEMDKLIKELHYSYETREKLRLEALQAQINPHFLFNTLNSIKWMAAVQGAPEVSKMIAALGSLLDATLYRDEEMIPLFEEVKNIDDYITLQKMRFGDKFAIRYEIPEEITEYRIPVLIFQPLIENSIIHGFADMDAGGVIIIRGEVQESCVYIEISDNGKGMSEEALEIILSSHNLQKGRFSNIGVRNVNDRIMLRYGNDYGIKVLSEEGKGTTILIKLPPAGGVDNVAKADYC